MLVRVVALVAILAAVPVDAGPEIDLPAEAWVSFDFEEMVRGPFVNETNHYTLKLEFNERTEVRSYWANAESDGSEWHSGALGTTSQRPYNLTIGDVDWFAYAFEFDAADPDGRLGWVFERWGRGFSQKDSFTDGPSITITNESINIGAAPMRAPYQILIGNGTDLANITSMVALPHNETSLPRPGGVVVAAWLVDVEWLHWSQKVGGGVCHPGCEVPRYVVFDGLNVTMPEAPDPVSDAPVPESPGAQESPLPLVLVVLALVAALRRR